MKKLVIYMCLLYMSVVNGISDVLSNSLSEHDEVSSNDLDSDLTQHKLTLKEVSKVNIKLFYECHCPGSRQFGSIDLKDAIEKLNDYLEIKTYPYGNAETKEHGGKIEFECQHGPRECYGNELHACALEIVTNNTKALLFNACMMDISQEGRGSDDKAADKCGSIMGIDATPIKACAKNDKGIELLKYYGEESKKVNFEYVPYILINGNEYDRTDNFIGDLCAYLSNPPPSCQEFIAENDRTNSTV